MPEAFRQISPEVQAKLQDIQSQLKNLSKIVESTFEKWELRAKNREEQRQRQEAFEAELRFSDLILGSIKHLFVPTPYNNGYDRFLEGFNILFEEDSDQGMPIVLSADMGISYAHKVFAEMPTQKLPNKIEVLIFSLLESYSCTLAKHCLGVDLWPTGIGTLLSFEYVCMFGEGVDDLFLIETHGPVKEDVEYSRDCNVVISATTSNTNTNTSNDSVTLGETLVAQTGTGSGVVTKYTPHNGRWKYLSEQSLTISEFGCTLGFGDSGHIVELIIYAISRYDYVEAVLTFVNQSFEVQVHGLTRAKGSVSPPLVVAHALAGTVDIDFDMEPIGIRINSYMLKLMQQLLGKIEVTILTCSLFSFLLFPLYTGTVHFPTGIGTRLKVHKNSLLGKHSTGLYGRDVVIMGFCKDGKFCGYQNQIMLVQTTQYMFISYAALDYDNGQVSRSDYLNSHLSRATNYNFVIPLSFAESRDLQSIDGSYSVSSRIQRSFQQITSQFYDTSVPLIQSIKKLAQQQESLRSTFKYSLNLLPPSKQIWGAWVWLTCIRMSDILNDAQVNEDMVDQGTEYFLETIKFVVALVHACYLWDFLTRIDISELLFLHIGRADNSHAAVIKDCIDLFDEKFFVNGDISCKLPLKLSSKIHEHDLIKIFSVVCVEASIRHDLVTSYCCEFCMVITFCEQIGNRGIEVKGNRKPMSQGNSNELFVTEMLNKKIFPGVEQEDTRKDILFTLVCTTSFTCSFHYWCKDYTPLEFLLESTRTSVAVLLQNHLGSFSVNMKLYIEWTTFHVFNALLIESHQNLHSGLTCLSNYLPQTFGLFLNHMNFNGRIIIMMLIVLVLLPAVVDGFIVRTMIISMKYNASALLDVNEGLNFEKMAQPSPSFRGFVLIDSLDFVLREVCARLVSCSGLLVMATRVIVIFVGGPFYHMLAFGCLANSELLSPMINTLALSGFDKGDFISLLGAHSTGAIYCILFWIRLYNCASPDEADPPLDSNFRRVLRSRYIASYMSSFAIFYGLAAIATPQSFVHDSLLPLIGVSPSSGSNLTSSPLEEPILLMDYENRVSNFSILLPQPFACKARLYDGWGSN